MAAQGRRYGSHAGPNTAGRLVREPLDLRGGPGRGRVGGRARGRHHAAALPLEPRGPRGPAGPAAGLPRGSGRRRGDGKR